jgi:hypothetical protein
VPGPARLATALSHPAAIRRPAPAGVVTVTDAHRMPGSHRAARAARRTAAHASRHRAARAKVRLTSASALHRVALHSAWRQLLHRFHWARWQFKYLYRLWTRESGWNPYARNPGSGAYGIPQAVPAGKMASAGRDWRWNPRTQIRWGLRYIAGRYGSPAAAWRHETVQGWY